MLIPVFSPPFFSLFQAFYPLNLRKKMENEKKTNMSKKEANKYMRFLIKEWTEAGTEVEVNNIV